MKIDDQKSKPNGSRKIANAFMLMATFCFAGSLPAVDIGGTAHHYTQHTQLEPVDAPCTQLEQLIPEELALNATLHEAARRSNGYQEIPALIAQGANVNNKDDAGNTPLHIAAWNGNVNNCKALLEAGADKEIKNKSNTSPHEGARVAKIIISLFNQQNSMKLPSEEKFAAERAQIDQYKRVIDLLDPAPPSKIAYIITAIKTGVSFCACTGFSSMVYILSYSMSCC